MSTVRLPARDRPKDQTPVVQLIELLARIEVRRREQPRGTSPTSPTYRHEENRHAPSPR